MTQEKLLLIVIFAVALASNILAQKKLRFIAIQIVLVFFISCIAKAQYNPVKYQVNADGYSLSIRQGWNNSVKALRMDHRSNIDTVHYDEYFNRGIRRGNNILVTGDKPRFALLKHLAQDQLSPDMIKLGDGKIAISINGKEEWLHLQKKMEVNFYPAATEYAIALDSYPQVKLQLLVSQAKDWGAVVKLSIENKGSEPMKLTPILLYGGISTCGRTFSAAYFSPDENQNYGDNSLQQLNNAIQISSKDIPGNVSVYQIPSGLAAIENGKAKFSQNFILESKGRKTVYYVLQQSAKEYAEVISSDSSAVEAIITESKLYYESILNTCSISTPDKILDAGFKTAVLNFDNIYAEPAWLEGVHWWASYWANNYQISAATCLGQLPKAKKALEFFNSVQYGPSPAIMLSGKPFVDSLGQGWEDGLPYYLFQLIEYYNHTGDTALMTTLWPALSNSIDKFFKLRDPDGNGLLNWHMGANAFLYQADHLGLPGDAASPSLIMAGMMNELSVIAAQLNYTTEAKKYKSLSDKIYSGLNKILWNQTAGMFYSHKDLQQIYHAPHYYTDFVFPALYTNLSTIDCWENLDNLYQKLWTNNYKGEKWLMRVGDLKPSIFGNDNVMPVQMAEAARAYYKMGDADRGTKLLSSVALAGTIFTEAPGNFPERLNDEGKGEANYLFGNPIGAFIQTTVNGLFGIDLAENGKQVNWHPAFPGDWNTAEIKLPYVKAGFQQRNVNGITEATYSVVHDKPRTLLFSLFINPAVVNSIYCNGKEVKYKVIPGIGKMQVVVNVAEATKQEITINYKSVEIKVEAQKEFRAGAKATWIFNGDIDSLYDPQQQLKNAAFNKHSVIAVVKNTSSAHHAFFVKLKNIPVLFPVAFNVKETFNETQIINNTPETKTSSTRVDISKYINTDTLYAFTEWRNSNVLFDADYFSSIYEASRKVFEDFGVTGPRLNMAMITYGLSDSYTRETVKTRFPASLTIPVNKSGQQLSLLFINEMETRLTGATVGLLILTYTDGSSTNIPLTVGKNVDALSRFFATELQPLRMKETDYAKIYNLPINRNKILKSFTIKINAADFEFGLIGAKIIGNTK